MKPIQARKKRNTEHSARLKDITRKELVAKQANGETHCNPLCGSQGPPRHGSNQAILPSRSYKRTYWTTKKAEEDCNQHRIGIYNIQSAFKNRKTILKSEELELKQKNFTVSVRWSRLTEVKRSRSLQQNLRNVVIAFSLALCLYALFFASLSSSHKERICSVLCWNLIKKGTILDVKFPLCPFFSK